MAEPAKAPLFSQPFLSYARVREKTDSGFLLHGDAGSFSAERAAGCLLAPEPGDLVLLSADVSGKAHILCVLERERPESPNRLVLQGTSSLEVQSGSFSMMAEGGIHLGSMEALSLTAPCFSLCATQADISLEETRMAGKNLTASLERIRTVAQTMDTFVKNWVQRMVSCFRYVKEHDEKQCASARELVSGTLTVQTGNSVHTAEGHVKIDAEQIHLG